jgi:hypothetical protein
MKGRQEGQEGKKNVKPTLEAAVAEEVMCVNLNCFWAASSTAVADSDQGNSMWCEKQE